MANQIYETREAVTQTPGGMVRDTVTATDSPTRRYRVAERLAQIITGIVASLLAIRFVLSLLGANRGNSFAELIYGLTQPLVAPFFGLFGYTMKYGVARFELETLVAITVYALVGFGIARLLSLGRVR